MHPYHASYIASMRAEELNNEAAMLRLVNASRPRDREGTVGYRAIPRLVLALFAGLLLAVLVRPSEGHAVMLCANLSDPPSLCSLPRLTRAVDFRSRDEHSQ